MDGPIEYLYGCCTFEPISSANVEIEHQGACTRIMHNKQTNRQSYFDRCLRIWFFINPAMALLTSGYRGTATCNNIAMFTIIYAILITMEFSTMDNMLKFCY